MSPVEAGSPADDMQDLVSRARVGEGAAWERLFVRSYPRLLAYASRRLPGTEQAKDAVGEAVTRAVAGIEGFRDEGGGFDAWMYGILRHVVADAQRAMRREQPGWTPAAAEGRDGEPEPGERAVDDEDALEVRRAFERLRPADQELLELRVVAGLSADEVAVALGRRPGAVRMAQKRALSRLRSMLLEQVEGRESA